MFVFLALVFGVGFVVFGVGSNAPSGLGDFVNFGAGGNGRPSVADARERVRDNPKDPAAYRALVTALRADQRPEQAIAPLERLTTLRPRDAEALNELAGLYLTKATRLQQEAQVAQIQAEFTNPGAAFLPAPDSKLGQALPQDPVTQTASEQANQRVNTLLTSMQEAFTSAEDTYTRLARLRPRDSSIQLQLASAAQSAGHFQTAITAYKRFLKLAPEDPTAPAVREQIKRLREALRMQPAISGGG